LAAVSMTREDIKPVSVAIVGCGRIFPVYARGLAQFPARVRIAWCTDIIAERARDGAALTAAARFGRNEDMLADPDVAVVINLTPPTEHAAVIRSALDAGKHVFTEKPLAITTAEAAPLVALARAKGLALGSAADTFLGSAGQTARQVIDSGELGEIFGFSLFSAYSRAELWHPDPGFLFVRGGGPVLDAGPYFIGALVNLLGPVRRVTGHMLEGAATRQVSAPDRLVEQVNVEVPTHAAALLEVQSGAVGTMTASFDVWSTDVPAIEIYGRNGMLSVPHPNWFGGDVTLRLNRRKDPRVIPPVTPPVPGEGMGGTMLRGYGVMDLIDSLAGYPQRTTGALALHVLEVLEAVRLSSAAGTTVAVETPADRPAPLTSPQMAGWSNKHADSSAGAHP
jgi:predicted dehydrogenase